MYLSMTTYNRPEYLKQTLDSLLKCNFPLDTHLVISDDHSTDPDTINMLNSIHSTNNLDIQILRRPHTLRCDRNMVETMKYCFSKTDDKYLITIDSDVIFNKEWMNKLLQGYCSIPINIPIAGVTAFNVTETHPILNPNFNDLLFEKVNIGGFCAMINRDLLLDNLRVDQWDWAYVDKAQSKGYRFFSLNKSYVQHIGQHGKSVGGNGYYDRALDFVGE